MDAKQIRNDEITGAPCRYQWDDPTNNILDGIFRMLREVAAQLAEMNERAGVRGERKR
jgi:hypothetical protein